MNPSSIPLLFFTLPGPGELLLIFLIVFLLFGARRLPEIAKGLGQAIREFKKTFSGTEGKSEGEDKK